jgi:hypothetical protein
MGARAALGDGRKVAHCGRAAACRPSNCGLALVNPRPQESWEAIAHEVVTRYLGLRQRHERMNAEAEHEPALLRSGAFARFTVKEFAGTVERDVASIIGHIYSMSTSPRSAFGTHAAEFERELTERLLIANPCGVFKESLETEVLLAPVQQA